MERSDEPLGYIADYDSETEGPNNFTLVYGKTTWPTSTDPWESNQAQPRPIQADIIMENRETQINIIERL